MMDTVTILELIVMVLMFLLTMTTNTITLFVMAWTDYLRNINRVYLYSATIADLCLGLFIMPFAIYCLVIKEYGYLGIDPKLCHLQAYVTIVFFLSGLYSLSWMNVDHYVAVRKPERYKVMMSPPRSLCWIGFGWIAAISFCCPPLLSFQGTKYYDEVYICTVVIGYETPYFITAGTLALLPAFFSLFITDVYLFTHGFRKKQKMYEAVLLEVSSRPRNYHINFLISIIYFGTWMPWCVLRICSFFQQGIPDELHFYTFWLAMGNACYKFFVYTSMSREYRRGLRGLLERCCKCLCFRRFFPQPNMPMNVLTTRAIVAKQQTTSSGPPAVEV